MSMNLYVINRITQYYGHQYLFYNLTTTPPCLYYITIILEYFHCNYCVIVVCIIMIDSALCMNELYFVV